MIEGFATIALSHPDPVWREQGPERHRRGFAGRTNGSGSKLESLREALVARIDFLRLRGAPDKVDPHRSKGAWP